MTASADIGSSEPVVAIKKVKKKLQIMRRIKETRRINGKI